MQSSAIAIWASHVKALEKFLLTNAGCALILEDDINLHNESAIRFFSNLKKFYLLFNNGFSIIQLGTVDLLSNSIFHRFIQNLYYYFFGLYKFQRSDRNLLLHEIGEEERTKIEKQLVKIFNFRVMPLFGYLIGAQSYLIKRNSAEWIISNFNHRTDWDLNSRYSFDTFLEEFSRDSNFGSEIRTLRLAKQVLSQRVSTSDNNFYNA
jgi:GR25 family glycosyltransferase involved in LPS biosynthesis